MERNVRFIKIEHGKRSAYILFGTWCGAIAYQLEKKIAVISLLENSEKL